MRLVLLISLYPYFPSMAMLGDLLWSIVFMLMGVAFALGWRYCDTVGFAAATFLRRSWKQRHWHVDLRPWLRRGFCIWHRFASSPPLSKASVCGPARTGACGNSASGGLLLAQEQLAVEIAVLLRDGRIYAAVELLCSVGAARGTLLPNLCCFRMVMQSLAASSAKPDVVARVMQEMSRHSVIPDPATKGCYVRCLCRGPSPDIDKAHASYTAMLAAGSPPDLQTVECLAEACLRMNRHDLIKPMIIAIDDANDGNIEPSAALYATLIISCATTGAVALGMAAFEQMRKYFRQDPAALLLGYSSAVFMCAQNQQVERAMGLLEESRRISHEEGLPPASLEAKVLPPLLAAAVQSGRQELALDLARQARDAIASAGCTPEGCKFEQHLRGLCKLLSRRQTSHALMLQVSAILADVSATTLPTHRSPEAASFPELIRSVLQAWGSSRMVA